MSQRRRSSQAGGLVAPALPPEGKAAHELCNVIGALQLRFGVLESDPTCRWAQEENLTAIRALLAQGMKLARTLENAAAGDLATLPPRPRVVTSRRR